MATSPRTVTGTLKDSFGDLLASTSFDIVPRGMTGQGGAGIVPNRVTVTSDGSGNVSFDLMPGNYDGYVESLNGSLTPRIWKFPIALTEDGSTVLSEIITATPVEITPEVLAAAEAARDEAESAAATASAAAATASAAAITADAAADNAQSSALTCATWDVLVTLTGSADGEGAEVLDSDTGSHLAASGTGYDGSTVSNAGRYSWNSSWSRWVRIGGTGLSTKVAYADGFKFSLNSVTGFPQLVDVNGVELLGFDSNGKTVLRLSPSAMALVLSDFANLGYKNTTSETFPSFKDANNVELLGFDSQARARFRVSPDVAQQVAGLIDFAVDYDPVAEGLIASPSGIVIGDSMSTATVTSNIASALAGRTFSTLAKGGATAATMAVVMGASPLLVTLSGNQIPASGGVAVTDKNHNILASGGTYSGTANVSIAGVQGVLSTDSSGNWTFTRNTPGTVVAVAANSQATLDPDVGTAQIPATNSYRNRTAVIRLGRNSVSAYGTRSGRVTTTLEPMRKIIEFMTPRVKRLVIVSAYNGRAKDATTGLDYEPAGSDNYERMMLLNEEMQREFGRLYLDMRSAAVKNAIYDLGLTPTSDDLADMALDCIPRQLFKTGDNVHVNTTMQGWEGGFIGNHLRALGF